MQKLCPISFDRVNSYVARFNGGITVLLGGLYLVLGRWEILLFLAVDFFIRGFIASRYSYIAWISKKLIKVFLIKSKMINAGPKLFAAQVGTIMLGISLVSILFNLDTVAIIFISILIFFAFLESVFDYCVACKLYPLFRKITLPKPEYEI